MMRSMQAPGKRARPNLVADRVRQVIPLRLRPTQSFWDYGAFTIRGAGEVGSLSMPERTPGLCMSSWRMSGVVPQYTCLPPCQQPRGSHMPKLLRPLCAILRPNHDLDGDRGRQATRPCDALRAVSTSAHPSLFVRSRGGVRSQATRSIRTSSASNPAACLPVTIVPNFEWR